MTNLLPIIQFITEAVWHTAPLFFISILLSALVNALKLDGAIRRAFSAHVGTAVLLATAVGAFSPFCSCTVIPIIAGLLASGVPLAPIMAFWVASPTMDPEIFTLSVAILGWPLALARLAATLGLSLMAGYITLALIKTPLFSRISILQTNPTAEPTACCAADPIPIPVLQPTIATPAAATPLTAVSCTSCTPTDTMPTPAWQTQISQSFRTIHWPSFQKDLFKLSWELGRWLLLAFLLEALILQFIPQTAIANLLGESSQLAIPLAALIGIPLYLSNITALPIVSGLLAQGMQTGAAITFLIAGPVTTIPAMTAVFGIVHRRIFALYLAISIGGAILLGFIINWFF